MPRSILKPLFLLVAAGSLLTACAFLGSPFIGESGGCSPQLPASYRIQASVPVGVLEVKVTDAAGLPQASASVTAYWVGGSEAYPKQRCPSMVQGETGAEGVLRLERMKTGPYEIYLHDGGKSASASATVEAGKVATVALTRP